MRFGPLQKALFGASDGTYSAVTDREHYDSQITLTGNEVELAEKYFGNTIHIGRVSDNPAAAAKEFRLYPTGERISLNLVYPKEDKPELRLYISATAGFKPEGGQVWFLARKGGDLWIGGLDGNHWKSLAAGDPRDTDYQEAIHSTNPSPEIREVEVSGRTYARNPALGRECLKRARYQCEFDAGIGLFTARATGLPYVEVHHFIPLACQGYFDESLDCLENLIALSPHWHRAIHYASITETIPVVERLFVGRSELAAKFDVTLEDMLRFYQCEAIDQ
ncbi:MAG: hypothetical protein P1U86_22750 [Verrucomicrobiales bacterium]|nr:hypothetical protein [Verrucomicrobiales bacterium]